MSCCSVAAHHCLGWIDRLVLPFIRRDLERLRYGFDAVQNVCDARLQPDPDGREQPHGVSQMRDGADIRKYVSQAPLAHPIECSLERLADPGSADNLSPGTDRLHAL